MQVSSLHGHEARARISRLLGLLLHAQHLAPLRAARSAFLEAIRIIPFYHRIAKLIILIPCFYKPIANSLSLKHSISHQVTRPKSVDIQRKQTNRTVFYCRVFGDRRVGKVFYVFPIQISQIFI